MINHIFRKTTPLITLCLLQLLLFSYPLTSIQAVAVSDVRVTTSAESSAAARESAIEKAYSLAFQKLIKERFPGHTIPTPSQTQLLSMVSTFSIDQEKTTPTSYMASFTFQFRDDQLQNWLDKGQSQPLASNGDHPKFHHQTFYQTKVNYDSLAQWQQIKKALFSIPTLQQVQVVRFSPQEATISYNFLGDEKALEGQFLQKGLLFSLGENESTLSLSRN